MKRLVVFLFLGAVILAGCNGAFTAERVKEINNAWYKMYQTDRRPTQAEVEEYEALDDAGKMEWRKNRKPVNQVLSPRVLDATEDYFKSVEAEIESSE